MNLSVASMVGGAGLCGPGPRGGTARDAAALGSGRFESLVGSMAGRAAANGATAGATEGSPAPSDDDARRAASDSQALDVSPLAVLLMSAFGIRQASEPGAEPVAASLDAPQSLAGQGPGVLQAPEGTTPRRPAMGPAPSPPATLPTAARGDTLATTLEGEPVEPARSDDAAPTNPGPPPSGERRVQAPASRAARAGAGPDVALRQAIAELNRAVAQGAASAAEAQDRARDGAGSRPVAHATTSPGIQAFASAVDPTGTVAPGDVSLSSSLARAAFEGTSSGDSGDAAGNRGADTRRNQSGFAGPLPVMRLPVDDASSRLPDVVRFEPTPSGAEAGGTADAALDVPRQVIRAIQLAWRQGVGEARVQLQPEHLGHVTVSLRVAHGTVTAMLRAESPLAQERIQAHQHELRSALEAQGLRVGAIVVAVDPDERRQQPHPEPTPRQARAQGLAEPAQPFEIAEVTS